MAFWREWGAGLLTVALVWGNTGCGDAFTPIPNGAGGDASVAGGFGGGVPSTGGNGGGGQGGAPECNGADLSSDPSNCGECGAVCLSDDCRDGACRPLVIVDAQDEPRGVAITNAGVFWTHGTRLSFVDNDGQQSVVHPSMTHLLYLEHVNGNLYWTNEDGIVATCSVPCTSPSALRSNAGNILGVAYAGTTVYWTEVVSNGCLRAFDTNLNMPYDITCGLDKPHDVVADGGSLFWTEEDADVVMSVTGELLPVPLATGQPSPSGIAVDGTYVYWGTQGNEPSIRRAKKDGGGEVEIVVLTEGDPAGLDVSDDFIVWAETDMGTVNALSKP